MKLRFAPVFAILASAIAAQSGFTAQWSLLTPIVAEWTNAPSTYPNPVVSYPAGPLPLQQVVVAVDVGTSGWTGTASFVSVPLTLQPGMITNWSFEAYSWLPPGEQSSTTADLLLVLTGAANAAGSIEFRLTSFGDNPNSTAMRVDVGNDGVFELDAQVRSTVTTGLDRRAEYAWHFTNGPLLVRVLHEAHGWCAPQSFGLEVSFSPWAAGARSFGDDCGNEGVAAPVGEYCTHYHLAALPPLGTSSLMTLRATGLGPFAAFLVSDRASTVIFQLPGSPSAPCDLLLPVLFTQPGTVTRTVPNQPAVPVEWEARVPALPPGFDFWVQHASLQVPYLGLTNRLRIQT